MICAFWDVDVARLSDVTMLDPMGQKHKVKIKLPFSFTAAAIGEKANQRDVEGPEGAGKLENYLTHLRADPYALDDEQLERRTAEC